MSTIRRSATVIALGALLLLFATPSLAAPVPDGSTPGPSFDFLSWVEEAWSGLTSLWGANGAGMDPNGNGGEGGGESGGGQTLGSGGLMVDAPDRELVTPGLAGPLRHNS